MENKLAELEGLISKKWKINKGEADRAAKLLYEYFELTNDLSRLCTELVRAYYTVTEKFAMQYLTLLSKQDLAAFSQAFAQAILAKGKLAKSSLACGFTLLAVACKEQLFDSQMLSLLNTVVACAEQKGAFGDAKVKEFRKHLLDASKGKFLEADYSSWDAKQLARLDAYLKVALPNLESIAYRECVYTWRAAYSKQPSTIQPEQPAPQVAAKPVYAITPEMVAELQTLYQNAFIKNNAFRDLEEAIASKEALLQSLQEKTQGLVEKNAQLEKQVQDKEMQVLDLDERLTNIFKLDTIASNQELLTLKNDLATSLKLTYADYQALLSVPLSSDSYAFAKATLTHLFKILKRHGIEI